MVFFELHPIRWTVIAIFSLSCGLALIEDGVRHGLFGRLLAGVVVAVVSAFFGYHSIKWGYRVVRGWLS